MRTYDMFAELFQPDGAMRFMDDKQARRQKTATKTANAGRADEAFTASLDSVQRLALARGGIQTVSALHQLQRVQGNRKTSQMILSSVPARSAQLMNRDSVIQLDRLVEIQAAGGKDEQDFEATRNQVVSSVGTASAGNWLKAMFDVGATETVYIWGHMDETAIGTIEWRELAKIMVEKGFKGCSQIRLIGCNNQDTPEIAPKALWNALHQRFTKNKLIGEGVEEPAVMPTVYATKGPLHSSKTEGFEKGWWVGTKSAKETAFKQQLLDIIHYAKTGEFDSSEYRGSWLDLQVEHYGFKHLNGGSLKTISPEQQEKLMEKELTDKQAELRSKGKVTYPALQTEVGEEGAKVRQWNPDAWVSYSG